MIILCLGVSRISKYLKINEPDEIIQIFTFLGLPFLLFPCNVFKGKEDESYIEYPNIYQE